jgi:hypothetical protein
MDTTVQLKLEFENSLRRASIRRGDTLEQLKKTVGTLLGLTAVELKYRDEENDIITVGSDAELAEIVEASLKSGKILRLIVSEVASETTGTTATPPEATSNPEQPPREPEVPFIHLARALADPAVVGKIQTALTSPIITEAVNSAARAFADSKGDVLIAGLAASQQIPLLLGLFAELLEELPILKDLQTFVASIASGAFPCSGGGFGGFSPFGSHAAPHAPPPFAPFGCGAGGAFRGMGPIHRSVHPHVVCDGCSSDGELKNASFVAGHATRRGFINGVRYKSQSIHDFDLCESCKGSNRFPDRAYGPFVAIQPPSHFGGGRGGRCGGGGGGWWRGANENNNWRECGVGGKDQERTCGDAKPQEAAKDARPQESNRSCQPQQQPQQTAAKSFDFGDALREAISKGAQAVAEATKNDDSDFSELARAIAESLKDKTPGPETPKPVAASAATTTKGTAQETSSTGSDVKDSDWVPVAPVVGSSQDPFIKWGAQLNQLATLGFVNSETYVEFLEEENGDLDRVVNRIVRRDS